MFIFFQTYTRFEQIVLTTMLIIGTSLNITAIIWGYNLWLSWSGYQLIGGIGAYLFYLTSNTLAYALGRTVNRALRWLAPKHTPNFY